MPWSFSDMYGRQKVVDANVFPVMVPIFDTTLTSAQGSIDIQNIPQNYAHLKLVMSGMRLSAGAQIYMMVNGDATAGNYLAGWRLFGDGTSVVSDKSLVGLTIGGLVYGDVSSTADTAGRHTFGETLITDYRSTSIHKSWLTTLFNTTGTRLMLTGSLWANTAAVTRLTLTPNSSGTFAAGTRVTLYGIGVVAPASPGSVLPVQYGTTLPASPLDGQEAILVDNTSTPTYSWRFRYNANSANTDKWEFVGGTPVVVTVSTAETTASGAATDLATVGPAFTAPRAGIYQAQINADGANNTGGGDTFLDFKAGTNGAVSVVRMNRNSTANVGGGGGGWVQGARVNASDVLKMQYHVATGTGTFEQRTMAILPVRVS